jgi:hypothetical protein
MLEIVPYYLVVIKYLQPKEYWYNVCITRVKGSFRTFIVLVTNTNQKT